ncbi:MAG TPA: PEP-CTERM sorting domain-containing protein [Rariglobus sp.]
MKSTPLHKFPSARACLRVAVISLSGISMMASVHAATWDGNAGVGDLNWSTALNWSDDAGAAGKAVVFDNTFGATANATTAGNIVDASLTIDSLGYANSGSTWQVTQIGSGVTLTLDAGTAPATILSVSGGAVAATNAAITGAGSLVVNEATSNVFVGNSNTGPQVATLDMSGLGAFTATVNEFQLGVGVRGIGIVNLAGTNTITASKLRVGDVTLSTSGGNPNILRLGGGNTLNVDTIAVGANYSSGTLTFRSGLPTTSSVTIRAKDGVGRADMSIGVNGTTSVNNGMAGTVNFTGGTVDALINTLTIAQRADTNANGTITGTLSMSRGTIDATSVIVGKTLAAGSGASATTGTINVSGGAFTAGSVVMAQNLSGARTGLVGNLNVSGTGAVTVAGNVTTGDVQGTGAVTANVTVSGGALTVGGNLAEGANGASVTSTVTLSGGTLDMTRGNIAVDTFTFTGGTLKNVASFSAGTSGGLNVQNASTLAYDVDASFASTVLTGTLTLGASANLRLTLADDFAPTGSLLLVVNDDTDSIVGTFATINGVAFGAGNTFTLTNSLGSYDFTLSYAGGSGNDLVAVLSTIPEPSTYAMLAGLGVLGLAAVRRRRDARS